MRGDAGQGVVSLSVCGGAGRSEPGVAPSPPSPHLLLLIQWHQSFAAAPAVNLAVKKCI